MKYGYDSYQLFYKFQHKLIIQLYCMINLKGRLVRSELQIFEMHLDIYCLSKGIRLQNLRHRIL